MDVMSSPPKGQHELHICNRTLTPYLFELNVLRLDAVDDIRKQHAHILPHCHIRNHYRPGASKESSTNKMKRAAP
jgi:hypothetical protein